MNETGDTGLRPADDIEAGGAFEFDFVGDEQWDFFRPGRGRRSSCANRAR